jgi:hypothetical protein
MFALRQYRVAFDAVRERAAPGATRAAHERKNQRERLGRARVGALLPGACPARAARSAGGERWLLAASAEWHPHSARVRPVGRKAPAPLTPTARYDFSDL